MWPKDIDKEMAEHLKEQRKQEVRKLEQLLDNAMNELIKAKKLYPTVFGHESKDLEAAYLVVSSLWMRLPEP